MSSRGSSFAEDILDITLLPSVIDPQTAAPQQYLTSFLVNGRVAIDAGSLGIQELPGGLQDGVRHVLLTHTHLDHLATLPLFIENTYAEQGEPVAIHACQPVLDCLQQDFFNGRVWPDLFRLRVAGRSIVTPVVIEPGRQFVVDSLRITPVALDHVVPTVGFILEEGATAVIVGSDTAPTHELWRRAAGLPRLDGLFIETTFPDEMDALAALAKHLTPRLLAGELAKLGRPVRTIVTHIRIRYYDEVVGQLQRLNLPHVEIVEAGRRYHFGGSH
jgi:ribonuclease BN (tRNA processing enzyme)